MPKAFSPFADRMPFFFSAILLCSTAFGIEPAPTPEARAHFNAGVRHLEQGRHAEAYRELKAAYAITPRWTILGNLGIAAEHLERDDEAIDAMAQYLARGGADIDERETHAVQRAIERLKKGSASVTLEAPGTFTIIDTRFHPGGAVVNEYGPFENRVSLRVRSGEHEIELGGEGVTTPAWRADLIAGEVATHAFEVQSTSPAVQSFSGTPVEPPESELRRAAPSHTASYVMWGAGAAGAIAGAIIAVHASSLQSDADAEFARTCSAPASDDAFCSGTTDADRKAAHWRTAAVLTGAGALGALLGGTVMYFLEDGSTSSTVRQEASIKPWLSPTSAGICGTF